MPGPGRKFEKGHAPIPGAGRPKKDPDFVGKILAKDDAHRERLEYIAANGEDKDSIAAIKLLWAYAKGNPTQPVSGPDGGPIQFQGVNLLESLTSLAEKK